MAREALERIAAAAQRAPSADSAGQHWWSSPNSNGAGACGDLRRAGVRRGRLRPGSAARRALIPTVSEEIYRARYREPDKLALGEPEIEWPVPYWFVDVGATVMLILLAAVAEGLAAGFLGTHRMGDLAAELGLPADQQPVGVITVGHPMPDRRSGSLKRGWLDDDFVHWERCDGPPVA